MGLKGKKDNSRRKYPGIGGRRHNPVGKERARKEAEERRLSNEKMTVLEKLARLDSRVGPEGGKRERARLLALLKSSPVGPAQEPAKPAKKKAKERRAEAR